MAAAGIERARSDIVRLSHGGLGVREFSLAAGRVLRRVIPFDGLCLMTMDPIADAYGLTARERAITELVARGLSTSEISDRLFLSRARCRITSRHLREGGRQQPRASRRAGADPRRVHVVAMDGSERVEISGRGTIVSRRQADGSWRIVLDNPVPPG